MQRVGPYLRLLAMLCVLCLLLSELMDAPRLVFCTLRSDAAAMLCVGRLVHYFSVSAEASALFFVGIDKLHTRTKVASPN